MWDPANALSDEDLDCTPPQGYRIDRFLDYSIRAHAQYFPDQIAPDDILLEDQGRGRTQQRLTEVVRAQRNSDPFQSFPDGFRKRSRTGQGSNRIFVPVYFTRPAYLRRVTQVG